MKKFLLSMAAVALTASASWADVTTLVLDGENDLGDIPRINGTTAPTAAQSVKEMSFTLDGIECNLTSDLVLPDSNGNEVETTGNGFALWYNPSSETYRGIMISGKTNTQLTLTVPNGKITGVKLLMAGYSLNALDISFNGTDVSGESVAGGYSWTWSDAEGGESVVMKWVQTSFAFTMANYN
ncbi:MAG: hypothetical protein K2G23_00825, partial [Muribaculaceae bacterium]|nr:hypothetical protein [Muribaculaceae bacterium]